MDGGGRAKGELRTAQELHSKGKKKLIIIKKATFSLLIIRNKILNRAAIRGFFQVTLVAPVLAEAASSMGAGGDPTSSTSTVLGFPKAFFLRGSQEG